VQANERWYISADQAWFWTLEWQARVAEAEADRVAGNGTVYYSDEEFLASLNTSDADLSE
jgi:hypothetical protein